MAKKYDENLDYSLLMKQAADAGDYKSAAMYEQQRNAKINDMNAAGTNVYGATVSNDYGKYLMPDGFMGSGIGIGVNNSGQDAIRQQMNQNSIDWWSADPGMREQLEAQNKQLAAQLGGSVNFNPTTGAWTGFAKPGLDMSGKPSFSFDSVAPTWSDPYSDRIDAMLNQILNRPSFSYDAESDPIYQQYAKTYMREGERAMNDTLDAAASGANGMNSYALSAAQQAQNYYGAQLGDKIPELYQLAYQMYLQDIDNQVRDLGLLQGLSDTEYGRYRDQMSDYYADRDFSYGAYRDQMGDFQWEQSFDYNAYQDANEDAYNRAWDLIEKGIMPDDALLAAAGLNKDQIYALLNPVVSGGGGGPVIEWGDGYDTKQNANGVKASEWGYVKNNIATNLREGNDAAVEKYLDQVADNLSKSQWEEVEAMLNSYGFGKK